MKPETRTKPEAFRSLAVEFSLIHVRGGEKTPFEKNWQEFCHVKRAFDDIHFEERENAGIACGPASGCLVVDVDNPKLFESFVRRHGFHCSVTRTHQTGTGRHHFLYRYPSNGKPYGNRCIKTCGFDIRGDGGCVVAPGSIHPNGGRYLVSKDLPLAEPPQWLLDLYEKDFPEYSAVNIANLGFSERIIGHITKLLPRGERSEPMMSVLDALCAKGLSDDQIFYVFYTQPIGEKFLEKRQGRDQWLQEQIEKARKKVGKDINTQESNRRKVENPPHRVITAEELQDTQLDKPKWVEPGLVPAGLTLLCGKPKVGKSWLVLQLAVALATGGKSLTGRTLEQSSVLYVSLEDPLSRLQERLSGLLPQGEWPDTLHLVDQWPRVDEGGIDHLRVFLGEHPEVRVLIIDTFVAFRSLNPKIRSVYEIDYEAVKPVKELSHTTGVAVILVHHLNKRNDDGDPMDTISGSTGLTGAVDTAIIMKNDSQGTTLYVRGRDIEKRELSLRQEDSGVWKIVGDVLAQPATPEQKALLHILDRKGAPMKLDEIAKAVSKESSTVCRLLGKLCRDGFVTKVGTGVYVSIQCIQTAQNTQDEQETCDVKDDEEIERFDRFEPHVEGTHFDSGLWAADEPLPF